MTRINPFVNDWGDVIDIVIMAKKEKCLHIFSLILTTLATNNMSII